MEQHEHNSEIIRFSARDLPDGLVKIIDDFFWTGVQDGSYESSTLRVPERDGGWEPLDDYEIKAEILDEFSDGVTPLYVTEETTQNLSLFGETIWLVTIYWKKMETNI